MPDIRAVVFDFGGVLFDWSADYLYRELIPDEAERRWFLTHVCSPDWNLKQDCGRPIAEAEAELIALYPDHADRIRAFYGQWPKTLRGILEDGVALLEQLHAAGVPLYGLTNWSGETYHHVEGKYDFLERFRHVVVSGRVGMVKPDPRIYAIASERLGVPPAEIVFLDDIPANVDAARACGLQAILFTSMPQAIAEIEALLQG